MSQPSPRGVREAAFLGPNGERAFLAITSAGRLFTGRPIYVPQGSNPGGVIASLVRLLDAVDPVACIPLRPALRTPHISPKLRFLRRHQT